MSQWPFIAGAYALVLVGMGGLIVVSLLTMRRAEAASDELRRR